MGELYGEVNKLTLEWKDGLMATIVRHCCKVSVKDKIMIQYGDVDHFRTHQRTTSGSCVTVQWMHCGLKT